MSIKNNIGLKKKFCKPLYKIPNSVLILSSSSLSATISAKGNLGCIINCNSTLNASYHNTIKSVITTHSSLTATLKGKTNLEAIINNNSSLDATISSINNSIVNLSCIINCSSVLNATLLSNEKPKKGCYYEVIYVDKKYIVEYYCKK